jgi:hypothetical protein
VNFKMKTMKEEEEKVEACFLTHNISEVKKAC